ncbi:MAG: type II toxin-antitoxin system VapC family toxin [Bryobacteraceae bacterium]
MSDYVLDASVVLALVNREAGYQRMTEFLLTGAISSVNLSEVAAKLCERGLSDAVVQRDLSSLGLEVVEFDAALAFRAAALRPLTRKAGLSLADRACLATAAALDRPALTLDRTWSRVPAGVEIRMLR